MTEYTYPRNKNIKIQLTNINPGTTNLTIKNYEWTINNTIQLNNTNNITINTNNINLGSNNISWRIQNSCDSWSTLTTITINVTSQNVIYTKNYNLILKATNINPGASNLTIKNYEWKINGTQIVNNTDTMSINTNKLLVGINTVTLRFQNSCGSWSTICSYSIEVYKTTQTPFTIDINKPITDMNIQL